MLWPWFLIAARPRGGIEHYGNWVCRPTTSLREHGEHTHEGWRKCQQTMQIGSPSETQELRCGTVREPFNTSTIKSQLPAQFYRMTVLHAEPFNRLTYSYAGTTSTLFVSYCISDSACSKNTYPVRYYSMCCILLYSIKLIRQYGYVSSCKVQNIHTTSQEEM